MLLFSSFNNIKIKNEKNEKNETSLQFRRFFFPFVIPLLLLLLVGRRGEVLLGFQFLKMPKLIQYQSKMTT
jgi:hypothetical protein